MKKPNIPLAILTAWLETRNILSNYYSYSYVYTTYSDIIDQISEESWFCAQQTLLQ